MLVSYIHDLIKYKIIFIYKADDIQMNVVAITEGKSGKLNHVELKPYANPRMFWKICGERGSNTLPKLTFAFIVITSTS